MASGENDHLPDWKKAAPIATRIEAPRKLALLGPRLHDSAAQSIAAPAIKPVVSGEAVASDGTGNVTPTSSTNIVRLRPSQPPPSPPGVAASSSGRVKVKVAKIPKFVATRPPKYIAPVSSPTAEGATERPRGVREQVQPKAVPTDALQMATTPPRRVTPEQVPAQLRARHPQTRVAAQLGEALPKPTVSPRVDDTAGLPQTAARAPCAGAPVEPPYEKRPRQPLPKPVTGSVGLTPPRKPLPKPLTATPVVRKSTPKSLPKTLAPIKQTSGARDGPEVMSRLREASSCETRDRSIAIRTADDLESNPPPLNQSPSWKSESIVTDAANTEPGPDPAEWNQSRIVKIAENILSQTRHEEDQDVIENLKESHGFCDTIELGLKLLYPAKRHKIISMINRRDLRSAEDINSFVRSKIKALDTRTTDLLDQLEAFEAQPLPSDGPFSGDHAFSDLAQSYRVAAADADASTPRSSQRGAVDGSASTAESTSGEQLLGIGALLLEASTSRRPASTSQVVEIRDSPIEAGDARPLASEADGRLQVAVERRSLRASSRSRRASNEDIIIKAREVLNVPPAARRGRSISFARSRSAFANRITLVRSRSRRGRERRAPRQAQGGSNAEPAELNGIEQRGKRRAAALAAADDVLTVRDLRRIRLVKPAAEDEQMGTESETFANTVTANFQNSGVAKEYLPAMLREFTTMTQLRALDKRKNRSTGSDSVLNVNCIDPVLWRVLQVEKLGHKLVIAKTLQAVLASESASVPARRTTATPRLPTLAGGATDALVAGPPWRERRVARD